MTRSSAAVFALVLGACATAGRPRDVSREVAGPTRAGPGQQQAAGQQNGKQGEQKPSGPIVPKISARAQRLFDDAVAAEAEYRKLKVPNDWDALERKWKAVLEAEEVPEAYYNLGVVYEHQRKPDQAKSAYEKALKLKPTLKEAAINLAVMMENDGNTQAAMQTYIGVLRKYPDDAMSRVQLAGLYLQAGQLDEAWRFAREGLMRDPKAVGAYKVMMQVALQRGNTNLAKLLALRTLKLDDRDPALYFFVGQILQKEDDEPAAVLQFRKALAQKDDFMPARYELLRIALKKQNWDGVVDQGSRILKYEPNSAQVHLDLGIAYRYLGKSDQALVEYEQAEKLSGGKLAEVHLDRGLVLMKDKNKCEPAVEEFKKYESAKGATLAGNAPVYELHKECDQIIVANRQAEEAAKQMQLEAEKKKQEEEAKKKAAQQPGGPPPAPGATAQAKAGAPAPGATPAAAGKPGNGANAPAPDPAPDKAVPAAARGAETKPNVAPAPPAPAPEKPAAAPPAGGQPPPADEPDPDEPKG